MKTPEFPDAAVFICRGSKCGKYKDFRRSIKHALLKLPEQNVEVFDLECTDRCKHAPIACLQPHNIWYYEGGPETAHHIMATLTPSS